MYEGIILTGTSGSGKTTMAHHLSHLPEGFGQVKAVTTRALRPDDPAGSYEYITDADFDRLHTDDKLLVDACYRNDRYGIRRTDVEAVKRAGKTPILILTPESAARLDGNDVRTIAIDHAKAVAPPRYLSVFLDAPDAALDERLRQRGTTVDASVHQQREVDREYRQHFLYVVQNNERQHTVDLLAALWMYATRPGVLPARLILLMLKCGTLLDHADSKNVSGV